MSEVSNTTGINSVNEGLATAALLGANRGYAPESTDTPWKSVVGGGICDLRESVKDAASNIRADVKDAECSIRHDVGHSESEIRRDLKDSESTVRKDVTDVRFQVAQSSKEVENRVTDLERNVDTMFCKTNENIIKEASLTREKVTELARWRDDKEEARFLRSNDKQDAILSKLESCCCEQKLAFKDLQIANDAQFCKLSEQHLRQTLAETKDELTEARFQAILDKVSKGKD